MTATRSGARTGAGSSIRAIIAEPHGSPVAWRRAPPRPRLAPRTAAGLSSLVIWCPRPNRPSSPQQLREVKFGGPSHGGLDGIDTVAARFARAEAAGVKLVVVVSAMVRTAARSLGRARELSKRPSRRELDVLLATGEQQSMALTALA